MNITIERAIADLSDLWKDLNMESILKAQSILKALVQDPSVKNQLQSKNSELACGLTLHQDISEGFVLLAYSETQGTYRPPHDHGSAWVVYAVASGEVRMGNYFKNTRHGGDYHLILKNRELLTAGEIRIYYPGEIHDTKCISDNAIILRLTSSDLKEEERMGRMSRFQI